ncbi:hypothetical protein ACFSYD_10385 [Paracoccus aerius]
MIWVAATLIAATAQTARNAAQAGLTRQVGTMGATAVRFVFGFPFAAAALGLAAIWLPILAPTFPCWAGPPLAPSPRSRRQPSCWSPCADRASASRRP